MSTRALIALAVLAVLPTPVIAGPSDGSVALQISVTDPERVVVYVEGAKSRARNHTVRQANLRFEPRITVIGTDETVEFPNDDTVTHNVFSVSLAKKFNLGLYRQGQSKSVTFDKPGTIDVFCNIHSKMHASIVVVPSASYGRADKDGRVRLDGLPTGKHTVVVLKNGATLARTAVVVTAGQVTEVKLKVSP